MTRRGGLAVAGVALVLAGAGLGVWESPWVRLHTVQVTGNRHETAAQVRETAALVPGTRLWSISSAEVSRRLAVLPWVQGATVIHILPSRVRIVVRERIPAAVVQVGERRYLVDATGVVLAEAPVGEPEGDGEPLITGIPIDVAFPGARLTQPGFSAALAVLQALPSTLRPEVASVNAPSAELLRVVLGDGTAITYGSPQDLAAKNADVITLLGQGKRYVSIDVRSPDHPAAVPR